MLSRNDYSMNGGPLVYLTDGSSCVILLFKRKRLFCAKTTSGTRTMIAAVV